MPIDALEPQDLFFSNGATVNIAVKLLAHQYANGATLAYRFQVFSAADVLYVNKTGSATVASGEITITLSSVESAACPVSTNLSPDYQNFLLWDTAINDEIAYGYAYVKKGLRA